MRYILHAMNMNLRRASQYRLSFLLQTLSQVIMTGSDLAAVLILAGRFSAFGAWSADQVLFFFGAMQTAFALTEGIGRGVSVFSREVQSGSFDTLLLRPRALLGQVMLSEIDARRIGSVLIGAAALAAASARLRLIWTFSRLLLLLWSILGTVTLLTGLFLIEASVSFFTVQSIEAVNVLTYGGRQVCQYPADLYPGPIRLLFEYVAPIVLCLHLPVSLLLGRPMVRAGEALIWLCPLAGFAFFGLTALLWRFGVRHYRSTGS